MGKFVKIKTTAQTPEEELASGGSGGGKKGKFVQVGDVSKIGANPGATFGNKKEEAPGGASSLRKPSGASAGQGMVLGVGGPTRQQVARSAEQAGKASGPSLWTRTGNVLSGAAKGTGAGYANTGGMIVEGLGRLNTAIEDNQNQGETRKLREDNARYQAMLDAGKDLQGKPLTEEQRKIFQSIIRRNEKAIRRLPEDTKAQEARTLETAGKAYAAADRLAESSARDVEEAKEGLGTLGQFAVDVGVAGAQMAGDLAPALLTGGSALPAMALRGFGSAAQEARQAGASYGQQLGYGLGSAAVSVGTEKLASVSGLAQKVAGKTSVGKWLAARLGEKGAASAVKQAVEAMDKTAAGHLALAVFSEGGEEAIEDALNPLLKLIYQSDGDESAWENIRRSYGENFSPKEVLYDFLVGGALGGLGAAGDVVKPGSRWNAERRTETGAPVLTDEKGRTFEERQAAEMSLGEAREIARNFGAELRVDVMENQGDVLHRAYNLRSVEYKNAPLGWASEEDLRAGFQDRTTASGGYTISVADLVKNIKQDYVGNHVIFAAKEGTDITPRLTDEKGRTYEERQNSMGRSFTELVEEQRRAAKAEQKTADAKDASSAMKALGLDNITGDLGEYRNTDFLRGADAARKQTVRERRKAEARLHPTNAEKKFARGIANGDFSVEDIPASMSRAVVEEMADRYYAEASYGKRSGLQDRGAEIRRRTEKMARELFEDEESYHPISMLKMNERTPERVMRSIYGEEQGEKINEAYIYPIQRNEANKTRWMREMLDKVRTFQDSNGGQSELTRQERALVQQLMEDRFVGEQLAAMETQGAIRNAAENIRNGADAKDAAREFSLSADELALARQLVRWTENQELLQSGRVDSAKINAAVETFAKQYDLFYDAINDFLTAHGYNTIGFIKGYAPHMQGADTQNKLSNALKALGVLPEAAQLPTSISGLTADYKPGKRWNPFFQSRKGSTTDYDVSKGYESYISYLADIFYHTDDIARLRGVTRYLRRTYGSEQITDAIDHAEGLRTAPLEMQTELLRENGRINGKTVLSEEDTKAAMNEYIDKLYESVEQMTKYGELVKYLDNFANLLAGKQSMADRGMEYMAGRKSLNAANKAVSAFGRAQVAGNVSSVLNQSAQLSQILAEVPTKYVAKAAVDLGKKTGVKFWTIKDTDIFETSDLLSGKKGVDYLTAGDSRMDRIVTALFKPADIMDGAVSALAYQSKYNQLIAEGKPTAAAELGADRWATQIMASRAKGSRPLAFESKNVASQILHMFQVEALNSWEHVSQDLSAQYRKTERTKGKNAAAAQVGAVATKYLLSAFVMNRITEALYGGTPAPFDLLGYVTNAVASGLGMTANEALAQICRKVLGKMGFGDEPDEDDKERDFDWGEAMDALLYDVMNDAPFVRNAAGLLGLGDQTMPLTNIAESVGDVGEAVKNSGVLSAETGEAILGLGANLLPGGRQLQKTYQGAKTMATGGRTYGYGEKARLQYTVDQKDLTKWGQALLFGNSGLSETRDYYAEGKNGLSAKQTETVQTMARNGSDRGEVFRTVKALREEKTAAEKVKAINAAELSDEEKLQIYRDVVASDGSKRPEQFKSMMESGMSWSQITDAYGMYAELDENEEMSPNQKATRFAAWLDGEGLSTAQKARTKETFAFWQQMRAEAKRYEALTAEGMNSGTAERLTNALAALEPEDGKEQVSARQRYAAIMDAGLSESDQLRALRSVMDEDAWKTFETANSAGVTPEVYVEFLEETADLQADRAGNGKTIAGSKKQKVLAAIDAMDITKEQKTALYYAAGYAESTLTEAPWMGLQVPRLDSGTRSSRKKSSGKSKGKSSSGSKQRSGLDKYSLDKYKLGG